MSPHWLYLAVTLFRDMFALSIPVNMLKLLSLLLNPNCCCNLNRDLIVSFPVLLGGMTKWTKWWYLQLDYLPEYEVSWRRCTYSWDVFSWFFGRCIYQLHVAVPILLFMLCRRSFGNSCPDLGCLVILFYLQLLDCFM